MQQSPITNLAAKRINSDPHVHGAFHVIWHLLPNPSLARLYIVACSTITGPTAARRHEVFGIVVFPQLDKIVIRTSPNLRYDFSCFGFRDVRVVDGLSFTAYQITEFARYGHTRPDHIVARAVW
jgi:hypothetical protein